MADHPSKIQQQERLAGLLLIGAAALALLAANSGLAHAYHALLETKFGPSMPRFGTMSLHYWVADGLMVIFFLLVGLEVKREWYDGQLATPQARRLPMIAAAAGMAVPALTYFLVIGGDAELSRGWAIPAATDIAFALGVLALIGSRVPASIKLLLVTIAIIDDIGAVIIIAVWRHGSSRRASSSASAGHFPFAAGTSATRPTRPAPWRCSRPAARNWAWRSSCCTTCTSSWTTAPRASPWSCLRNHSVLHITFEPAAAAGVPR